MQVRSSQAWRMETVFSDPDYDTGLGGDRGFAADDLAHREVHLRGGSSKAMS